MILARFCALPIHAILRVSNGPLLQGSRYPSRGELLKFLHGPRIFCRLLSFHGPILFSKALF